LARHIDQHTSREVPGPVAQANFVAFGQSPNAARMVGFVLVKSYDPPCKRFFSNKKL
jgi:hypothetical protein